MKLNLDNYLSIVYIDIEKEKERKKKKKKGLV